MRARATHGVVRRTILSDDEHRRAFSIGWYEDYDSLGATDSRNPIVLDASRQEIKFQTTSVEYQASPSEHVSTSVDHECKRGKGKAPVNGVDGVPRGSKASGTIAVYFK